MNKKFLISILILWAAKSIAQDSLSNQPWDDPALAEREDRNIEKYRKGDAVIKITGKSGKPISEAKVIVQQQTHEFLFGCNLFVLGQLKTPELNTKYGDAFAHLFNFATIPFYWKGFEPEKGKPRFSENSSFIWRRPPSDPLVKWCKEHDITVKGHALMYNRNSVMPDWTAKNNPDLFLKQAKKHMEEIAKRYKDDIAVWDVVNEERYRTLYPETGHEVPDDYLPWCFREAAKLFPKDVKLIYNDDLENHEDPEKYAGFINDVKGKGIRIDGMGIQFHIFDLNIRNNFLDGNLYPPDLLINFYDRMAKFGLPIYITEITIAGYGENGYTTQAKIVKNLYRLWFSIPNMAGITWWNLGDGTAYGKENEKENKALGGLLDKNMDPKPAYDVLDELINHEWKTNETITTGSDGKARFHGFYGKYKATVIFDGKTYIKEINLSNSGNNNFNIEL